MEKKEITGTSTQEMVTISSAEYEKLLGQEQQLLTQNVHISRLEKQFARSGRGGKAASLECTGSM